MRRIAKPMTDVSVKYPELVEPKDDGSPPSDVSIQRLIDSCLVALQREVKNILRLSVNGKLDASMSRDLRDYTKLLFELKEREDDTLANVTDEALEAEAKAVLAGAGDPSEAE